MPSSVIISTPSRLSQLGVSSSSASFVSAKSSQSKHNVEISNEIFNIIKQLQCDVKKLELQVKIVAGDTISKDDYNKIKTEIELLCGSSPNTLVEKTEDFIKEMNLANSVNVLKKVLTYLELIAPMCKLLNVSMVTNVLKNFHDILPVKELNDIYNKSFETLKESYDFLSRQIKFIIGSGVEIDASIDMSQNLLDLGIAETFVSATNSLIMASRKGYNKLTSIERSIGVLFKPITDNKRLEKLIKVCNKLWIMSITYIWLYILFTKLKESYNSRQSVNPILISGGKKKVLKNK